MLNKKTGFLIVISMLIGLEWSKIYVTDNFEKPIIFKSKRLLVKGIVSMVFIAFIFSLSFAQLSHCFIDNAAMYFKFLAIKRDWQAKIASDFNFGTEYANIRNFLGFMSSIIVPKIGVKTTDTKINGVSVRIYHPKTFADSKEMPLLVFIHGGAFVFGTIGDYDSYLAELVNRLDIVAVSIDYGLAPEKPFPRPTDDCYSVIDFIFKNPSQFKADPNKIILAGDSAGGNAVAVLTQRLLSEKKKLPKLQVLIYPWTQLINFRLPSHVKYGNSGLFGSSSAFCSYVAWYLGILNVTEEIKDIIHSNSHFNLIGEEDRNKVVNFLNIDQISAEYKKDKTYYDDYSTQKQFHYSKSLPEDHLLKKDKNLANLFSKLYSSKVSPILADTNKLIGLPKTYLIALEWDTLKDEGLIYAERLKSAGVQVNVKFYEDAFHGIVQFIHPVTGYKVAREMLDDLVNYIKENI